MAQAPIISVIIVSYNCKELLEEAIRSVTLHVKETHEIIVVDNASKDGTKQVIPQLFPDIKFIANAGNNGFSKANNQGFEVSTGNYILLLNPDAMLMNGNYSKALEHLQNYPLTISGPVLLNKDRSLQPSVFAFPGFADVFKETFFLTYLFTPSNEKTLSENNYALSGACLLMPRDVYQHLNGLDNDLFWMDDVDFCYRAKQLGIQIRYETQWQVIHIIGQSTKKNYKVGISNQLISKLKFFKKHRQNINFILSAFFIQIHILLRIVLFALTAAFKPVYKSKLLAYCFTQTVFLKYIFTSKKPTF